MESFGDSVKLMLFVYALAAVVSFAVAWVIKLIFAGIQWQKARAEVDANVPAEAADEPAKAASETAA